MRCSNVINMLSGDNSTFKFVVKHNNPRACSNDGNKYIDGEPS